MLPNYTRLYLTWITDPYNPEVQDYHRAVISALSGDRFYVVYSLVENLERTIYRFTYEVVEQPGDREIYGPLTIPILSPGIAIRSVIEKITYLPVSLTLDCDESFSNLESELELDSEISYLKNKTPSLEELKGLQSIVNGAITHYLGFQVDSVKMETFIDNSEGVGPTQADFYSNSKRTIGFSIGTGDLYSSFSNNQLLNSGSRESGESERGIESETTSLSDLNKTLIIFTPQDKNGELCYRSEIEAALIRTKIKLSELIGYCFLAKSSLVWQALELNQILTEETNSKYLPLIKTLGPMALMRIDNGLGKNNNNEILAVRIRETIKSLLRTGHFSFPLDLEIRNEIDSYDLITELALMWNMKILNPTTSKNKTLTLQDSTFIFGSHPEHWMLRSVALIQKGLLPMVTIPTYFSIEARAAKIWRAKIFAASLISYQRLSSEHIMLRPFISEIRVFSDFSISVSLATREQLEHFKRIFEIETKNLDNWYVEHCGNSDSDLNNKDKDLILNKRKYWFKNHNVPTLIIEVDKSNYLVAISETRYQTPNYSVENILNDSNTKQLLLENRVNELEDDNVFNYSQWGWRGLFNFDTLPGLLRTQPHRHFISPPEGEGKIEIEQISQFQYTVYVLFDNNLGLDRRDLFNILLQENEVDFIVETTTKLWKCGWFLSYWNSSLLLKLGKYGSTLNSNDPNLITAADTWQDAQIAREYLKLSLSEVCYSS